jgi:hypothetical protein
LNDILQLNSVFKYEYDYSTNYYRFYFNDIFHGEKIGQFRYESAISDELTIYDIGKLTFVKYIKAWKNYHDYLDNRQLTELFDDNTINKISFVPKSKHDIHGAITSEEETNFNTNFNTFIILNSAPVQVI